MKKLLVLVMVLTVFAFVTQSTYAQSMMMGGKQSTASSTQKDEAEGKAVWDKLQNKQVVCADLKDDDFDVLGDYFMGRIMGVDHESMNDSMEDRLGDDGEKQMHIALGKRLSECNVNAAYPIGYEHFSPMMGGAWQGNKINYEKQSVYGRKPSGNMQRAHVVVALITWFALMTFLITGSKFFIQELKGKK